MTLKEYLEGVSPTTRINIRIHKDRENPRTMYTGAVENWRNKHKKIRPLYRMCGTHKLYSTLYILVENIESWEIGIFFFM